MKIELKKIHYSPSLSEETNAFTADIYVDGNMAGHARNSGHGGNTDVHIISPEIRKRANEYAKALPPIALSSGPLPMDLEHLIDTLLEEHLKAKENQRIENTYKRWCKKSVVFRVKGDKPNTWRTLNTVYVQGAVQHLRQKHGDQLEEILNERFL